MQHLVILSTRQVSAMQRLSCPHGTCLLCSQETDLIRLKREAKLSKGFYVEPEAKLAFVVRIRGLNKIHPKVHQGDVPCMRCSQMGPFAVAASHAQTSQRMQSYST